MPLDGRTGARARRFTHPCPPRSRGRGGRAAPNALADMGTAPCCVAPLSPAGHAPRATMAQAARTARSPTKTLNSRAA
eukprot:8456257-Pyramimonas_sp.AAC.1